MTLARTNFFCWIIIGFALSSCALENGRDDNLGVLAQSTGPSKNDPNSPLSIRNPEKWVGTELGLPPETWEDLGPTTLQMTPDPGRLAREISRSSQDDFRSAQEFKIDPNAIGDLKYVGFDLKNGRAYRVTVKSDSAKAISEALRKRGIADGSFGDRPPSQRLTKHDPAASALAAPSGADSWSDGVDSRIRRSLNGRR